MSVLTSVSYGGTTYPVAKLIAAMPTYAAAIQKAANGGSKLELNRVVATAFRLSGPSVRAKLNPRSGSTAQSSRRRSQTLKNPGPVYGSTLASLIWGRGNGTGYGIATRRAKYSPAYAQD